MYENIGPRRPRTMRTTQIPITQSRPQQKDNTNYMNIFPLEKSLVYMDQPEDIHKLTQIPTNKLIEDQQLVENVRNMIKYEKIESNEVNKHLSAVTSTPIVAKNMQIPIPLLDSYPLQKNDIVPVCENKMFVCKSYFNYLFDQEVSKNMKKIQSRNQNLGTQLLTSQLNNQQNKPKQQDSQYKSKYLQYMGTVKQSPMILDPKHRQFQNEERIKQTFQYKEKQRLDRSRNVNLSNKGNNNNFIQNILFSNFGNNNNWGAY